MPEAAAAAPSAVVARNRRRLSGIFCCDMAVLSSFYVTASALRRFSYSNSGIGHQGAGPAVLPDHRRPRLRFLRAGTHQIHLEGVAIGPVKRVQMFDGPARLIANDAHEFDQRRSGAYVERVCDIRCSQTGADALAGMLDFHTGSLQKLKQRAR